MWLLRRQQRRLWSKSRVDPWHVSSGFFVFLADKFASRLVIGNSTRSSGGPVRGDEKNPQFRSSRAS